MYSIFRQESTGLWVVKDDSTGQNLGRGELPITAINFAIQKGMPPENKDALLTQADSIMAQEKKEAEAQTAQFDSNVAKSEEQTTQQNKEYVATGGANDDNPSVQRYDDGSSTQTFDDGSTVVVDSSGNLSSSDATPDPSAPLPANAGTTTAGKAGTTAAKTAAPKPGKRLKNPLGEFASYTYQITLYMVTPDAYNMFVQSGRRNINAIRNAASVSTFAGAQTAPVGGTVVDAGAYVIAQSGGINDTTTPRAPGFKYDYYIDDLKITTATSGKKTQTSSNTISMNFTIVEPYGFSFITKLKTAAAGLAAYAKSQGFSKIKGYEDCENPMRQIFVVGIRFQGYDINGNVLNATTSSSADTFRGSTNSSGIFERFYDIEIVDMKFKIDGGAARYQIEAASKGPRVGFGIRKGRTHTGASATANTVKEALGGLNAQAPAGVIGILTQMNNQQKALVKDGTIEIANEYDVKFIGDSKDIEEATIVSKFADPDKTRWPMAPVKTTDSVNDKATVTSTPDNTKRVITFKNDTPITQMVTNIISQSSYLEDALKVIFTTATQPDQKTDSPDEVKPDSNKTIKWYNLSSEIEVLGYDRLAQDFAYRITYVIQPYETPVVVSSYANNTTKYYGPHKRYDYWFTGENTEIIRYEQQLNLGYFTVKAGGGKDETNTSPTGSVGVPVVTGMHTPVARQGKPGIALEAQNNYITSLVDPDAWAEAKLTIVGDPDYLMSDTPGSLSGVYNQFYGTDGYTINANGGQVFIEINFLEAIDYNNETGKLEVNDKIMFWEYPPEIQKSVKGVSYQVLEVVSNFKGGKFTQDITAVINTFPKGTEGGTSAAKEPTGGGRTTMAASSDPRRLDQQGSTNSSGTTGLTEYSDPSGASDSAAIMAAAGTSSNTAQPNNQATSPTGNANNTKVADDDSSFQWPI